MDSKQKQVSKHESKVRMDKKSVIWLTVLSVFILIFIGVFLYFVTTGRLVGDDSDSSEAVNEEMQAAYKELSEQYSKGLTDDGYYEGIRALDYVTLPENYENLHIDSKDVTVDESVIDEDIEGLRVGYGDALVVDGAVEEKDIVYINYKGTVDGVAFEGGTAENESITLGSGGYVDGFEEQIIGHKAGETFDITVTFPKDYGDSTDENGNSIELSGKEAVFTITIEDAFEKVLSDDNVKLAFGSTITMKNGKSINTVEEARQYFQEYEYDVLLNSAVISAVLDTCQFSDPLPEAAMETKRNIEKSEMSSVALSSGFSNLDQYMAATGNESIDKYLEEHEETYQKEVKFALAIQAMAEDRGIKVEDKDLKKSYGDDYENIVGQYGKGYIAQQYLLENITTWLCNNAVVI